MKNEDEKARIDNEYGKMSGTQKEFHAYGYMENMNNPVIDEKRLHEQLTDRITDNTAGTVGIYACGDMSCVSNSAQEAHKSLVCG